MDNFLHILSIIAAPLAVVFGILKAVSNSAASQSQAVLLKLVAALQKANDFLVNVVCVGLKALIDFLQKLLQSDGIGGSK